MIINLGGYEVYKYTRETICIVGHNKEAHYNVITGESSGDLISPCRGFYAMYRQLQKLNIQPNES